MKQIGSLFDKYKVTLVPPQASVEKQVVLAVGQVTGITIMSTQVTYNLATRTVVLRTPGVLTSEIRQQKTAILAAVRSAVGVKAAPVELL